MKRPDRASFSVSCLRFAQRVDLEHTSKVGLAHLTRQQAAELGEIGVRVSLVAPGPVETELAKKVHSPAIRADYHDAIPLARYRREEELSFIVVFLCGEGASYVTGQTIAVDGGFDAAGIGLKTLRENSDGSLSTATYPHSGH